jgi:hypothetical protein
VCLPCGEKLENAAIRWSFNTPSFLLKWRRPNSTDNQQYPEILLFCLESTHTPPQLEIALIRACTDVATFAQLREDPYGIFAIIVSQWFSWNLELFFTLERMIKEVEDEHDKFDFTQNSTLGNELTPFDFSMLHRISKRIIQYMDTLEVTTEIQDSLLKRHTDLMRSRNQSQTESFFHVDAALQYHRITFLGAQSRAKGLAQRMENQINLVSRPMYIDFSK